MALLEIIQARQSIRHYRADPIEEEKLSLILEAGRLAPSARNRQDWKFVVVRDKALIQKLVHACCDQKFVGGAPAFLAVCTDNHSVMQCGQPSGTVDCSIALSFMMLQAAALGLGTCWLGSFREEEVKALLRIPAAYTVVAATPLGYPATKEDGKGRKPISEVVVYDDQWANG